MATFRNLNIGRTPLALLETPGKIYIEGQAHDASTLTPLFNDTFAIPNSPRIMRGALPMIGMNNRNAVMVQGLINSIGDTTMMDCNQGVAKAIKQLSSKTNAAFLPSGDYNFSGAIPSMYIDTMTGDRISQVPANIVNSDGASAVLAETADDMIIMTHAINGLTPNSSGRGWQVTKVNKNTGAVALLLDGGRGDYPYNGYGQMMHQSDFGMYFIGYTGSNANFTSSGKFHVLNKSSMTVTTSNLPEIDTGVKSVVGRCSKAISIDAKTMVSFVPYFSGTSTGDLIKFQAVTFKNDDSSAPVISTVVPTGASSQPGSPITTANVGVLRAWTFAEDGFNYVCVAVLQPTASALIENTGYIHVYKSPAANPYALQYVSSTKLNASAKAHIAMPMDDAASRVVVGYYGAGMNFLVWNKGAGAYLITGESTVNAVYMALDQTGRLWANDESATSTLNMFGPTVSNTIKFGFEDKTIKFTGVVIDSNLIVSAYNFMGERIVNNITLQIDSASATFNDGTKTRTVTTTVDGDLRVPIKIVGSGYIQVMANLAI